MFMLIVTVVWCILLSVFGLYQVLRFFKRKVRHKILQSEEESFLLGACLMFASIPVWSAEGWNNAPLVAGSILCVPIVLRVASTLRRFHNKLEEV